MTGIVIGAPRALLRLEGLLVLIGAVAAYSRLDASWWLFGVMFLGPDLSMLGYLANRNIGAAVYNFAHWYGLPFVCIAAGIFWPTSPLVAIGLIWAGHIGIDRALGFGLKYQSGFGASHLGIGKADASKPSFRAAI